jgi:hypothetical protein
MRTPGLVALTVLPVFLVLTHTAATAHAQSAGGFSAGPGKSADYGPGEEESPLWTQQRHFPGTRFWKLDKGRMAVETWWRLRDPRDGDAYNILQLELEVGLTDRIQLDVYENLTDEGGSWTREGTQIEARIAVDPVYGRTPLNPVIYLEWHPRHLAATRAEVRLLLGGELLGPRLVGAVNLLYEQNVTKGPEPDYIPNPEAGVTAAASYAVAGPLRVGAEAKLIVEKEAFDDAEWEKALYVGPNLSARIVGERFKLSTTVLFGVTDDAKKVDGFLVLSTGF